MRQHKTDDAQARILFSRIFTYFMVIALIAFLLLSFFLPYILSTPIMGRRLLRSDYLVGMAFGIERLLVVEKIVTTYSLILISRLGLALAAIAGLFLVGLFTHQEKEYLRHLAIK